MADDNKPTTVGRNDVLAALTEIENTAGAETANLIRSYIASLEAQIDHMLEKDANYTRYYRAAE